MVGKSGTLKGKIKTDSLSVEGNIERDEKKFLPKPYRYYCVKSYGNYLNISNLDTFIDKYK